MTEYAVLAQQHVDEGEAWYVIGYENARSARAAINSALETEKEVQDTRYVAVPTRSWRPVSVKVETKTALKFS